MTYKLVSRGKLTWSEVDNNFSFYSHPEGQGLFSEFTSGFITLDFTKILFPSGLAFNGKLSNQETFFNDLLSGTSDPRWQLFFDFEERSPMLSILPGDINWQFSLSLSPDSSCWLAGYDDVTFIEDFHIEHFTLLEWEVPIHMIGKIISVIDPAAVFGDTYC